jgi:signal transduction histidine kinase
VGTCASIRDSGTSWRACTVGLDGTVVTAAVRADAHRAVLQSLVEWMAAAVALALVGAAFASRVALRNTLRALRDLANWATRATEGTPPAAPRDGTREIDHLAGRFDTLVRDLVEALARERASSAHIAHELRTPLTAIVAELDSMERSPAVDRMRNDAQRLARVVDAVLVLFGPPAKERSGTIVNVADIARKLAPLGTPVEAPDEALVEAEPELVELAIHNLVENASKYAPGGTRVVRVVREADRVRVGVVDDGPGLPAVDREQMFNRYWRETSDGGGRGLGLALVRAVAERSGGRADTRDGRNGTGLDVGFSLGPLLAWSEA